MVGRLARQNEEVEGSSKGCNLIMCWRSAWGVAWWRSLIREVLVWQFGQDEVLQDLRTHQCAMPKSIGTPTGLPGIRSLLIDLSGSTVEV